MSFMSQTVGIIADLDMETEHLRWMGDFRFVVGFLQNGDRSSIPDGVDSDLLRVVVKRPTCQMEFSIKVAEQDKSKMVDALYARRVSASFDAPPPTSPLSEHTDDTPGSSRGTWIKYDKPCLWMFAGKGPYVSPYVGFVSEFLAWS